MNFWETYEKLCFKIGKKPNPVGKELGISSGTITQWKNGSIPSGEKLVQIADYFDVSVDYLLGRTEEATDESENTNSEQRESRTADGMTNEFFKVFEALDWTDKLDTMQFARERMRKESIS